MCGRFTLRNIKEVKSQFNLKFDPNKFPSLKKCYLKEGDPNLTATGIIRKNQSKVNPNNSKKNPLAFTSP